MAEVMVSDGTWTFDSEVVRIVPGRDRRVHKLRQAIGEMTVPLAAIAGAAVEPGRKGGRLRLRLRDGADPFLHVARGKLRENADPYRLTVDKDSVGAAEYFVDEVRNALFVEQIAPTPTSEFFLRGPEVPISATAGDGTVSFDGATIRIEWTEWAESVKTSAGPQQIALSDVASVEWVPIVGLTDGFMRIRVTGASALAPKHDPYSVTWGMQELGGTMVLVAAAVAYRLRHPNAAPEPDPAAQLPAGSGTDAGAEHDAVLQRLRELAELHNSGVLTDDEFAAAKAALLRAL